MIYDCHTLFRGEMIPRQGDDCMDRGCSRQPRSRYRQIILFTIAGLVLATLLPIVRSAPGLSRTPRRGPVSTPLAFASVDSPISESDQPGSSSFPPNRQEQGPGDSETPAEETLLPEWSAVRPSRGGEADRARRARESSVDSRVESPAVRPTRRDSLIVGSPRTGLSVRLCRLLF
jgi:hypothetical protein